MQNKNKLDQNFEAIFDKLNVDAIFDKSFKEINIWNWQIPEEERIKLLKEGTVF